MPGSRRYADPGTYLYTPEQWESKRAEFCQLVRKPAQAAEAIEQVKEELHQALKDLGETLANASPNDVGAVRLDEAGRLVIPPLSAEDIPAEARKLREELSGMLPFVPIASLLIELDARTGLLDCFTHAGGRKSKLSVEQKRNILAVLIAGATNLGLTRMSEACGVSYDTLAWSQEWYVREETLRKANTVLVNHRYKLELAKKFGGGTMSSSDGQRSPDELLSFIAPGHRENINFLGFIEVDIEAELAKLDDGWRPLRPTLVNESGTTFLINP
ncbi:hypothetical protein GCM10009733_023050 [Nonomuraea maheshkhaliensis]|uniref:Tn3 transposase DDE domain-containing protein n=1 Tax=Nonomuraea maheshkhaliensis TaxID=419590 RepID=A0ABN2F162_9ACTN